MAIVVVATAVVGANVVAVVVPLLFWLQVRAAAAACAAEAISTQRASFLRWGIMADWGRAYATMTPAYEASQLGVFRSLRERGLLCAEMRRDAPWCD